MCSLSSVLSLAVASSDPKKCKQQFAEDIKSGARRKKFLEEELPEYQKLADGNSGRAPSRKSQKTVEAAQEMRFICSVSCCSLVCFLFCCVQCLAVM